MEANDNLVMQDSGYIADSLKFPIQFLSVSAGELNV